MTAIRPVWLERGRKYCQRQRVESRESSTTRDTHPYRRCAAYVVSSMESWWASAAAMELHGAPLSAQTILCKRVSVHGMREPTPDPCLQRRAASREITPNGTADELNATDLDRSCLLRNDVWDPIPAQAPATGGPARGTLILDGGGAEGVVRGAMRSRLADAGAVNDTATKRSAVIYKFVQLAGGSGATIVVIPTAWDEMNTPSQKLEQLRVSVQQIMGVDRVTIMHTRDRRQADSPEFVAPLRRATGVWIDGGQDLQISGIPTWARGWRLKSRRCWPAAGSSPGLQPVP